MYPMGSHMTHTIKNISIPEVELDSMPAAGSTHHWYTLTQGNFPH